LERSNFIIDLLSAKQNVKFPKLSTDDFGRFDSFDAAQSHPEQSRRGDIGSGFSIPKEKVNKKMRKDGLNVSPSFVLGRCGQIGMNFIVEIICEGLMTVERKVCKFSLCDILIDAFSESIYN